MSQIIENLYIGDKEFARDISELCENTIIINCADEIKDQKYHLKIPLCDGTNNAEFTVIMINEIADVIHWYLSNNIEIVVHCMCGISRSTAVIVYYLMKYCCCNFDEAYDFVKTRRQFVNINIWFIYLLRQIKFITK